MKGSPGLSLDLKQRVQSNNDGIVARGGKFSEILGAGTSELMIARALRLDIPLVSGD